MKNLMVALLMCVSSYGETLNQSLRKEIQPINATFEVLVQSAPWCGACSYYKPEIERVRPYVSPNVTIEVVEDREIKGSPPFVPWTVIAPKDKKCRQEITGAVSASRLYLKILAVAKCKETL